MKLMQNYSGDLVLVQELGSYSGVHVGCVQSSMNNAQRVVCLQVMRRVLMSIPRWPLLLSSKQPLQTTTFSISSAQKTMEVRYVDYTTMKK